MRLIVYGDCIPIDPESLEESKRYPGLIAAAFPELEVEVMGYSGETTLEAISNLNELVNRHPDIVILNWGLNNALPRGLKRINRSRAIRAMYKLRMGKSLRWFCRTYMLNPTEYFLQLIRKPRFYYSKEETCRHFEEIVERLRGIGADKIMVVSINPIKNYRFRNANSYVEAYNAAIKDLCRIQGLGYADVFSKCIEAGLDNSLGLDKFHYSPLGHELAAKEIIKELKKLL